MVMGIPTKIWLVDMYCVPTILWMLLLFFDSSGTKHSFYASVIPAYDLDFWWLNHLKNHHYLLVKANEIHHELTNKLSSMMIEPY